MQRNTRGMMRRLVLTLCATAILGTSGVALATDRKIHNGSMCQPNVSTDRLNNFTGGAFNAGSTTIFVTCPIVRDNTQNATGTALAFVTVRSANGQRLGCDLVSRDKNGNFITSSAAATTSSAPTTLNVDVNSGAVLGTYALSCSLPPGGTIITYDIDEF